MGFEKGSEGGSIGGLRNDAVAQQEPASRHGFELPVSRRRRLMINISNARIERAF